MDNSSSKQSLGGNMFKNIVIVMAMLIVFASLSFGQFRVGGPWTPIPYQSGNLRANEPSATWYIAANGPEVFQYKDLGDTIFVDIEVQTGFIWVPAGQLIISMPGLPQTADNLQLGLCVIETASQGRAYAHYEIYGGYIPAFVIWPITGMFPNDQFPAGNIIVSIITQYRY
jgi:hypothetical protein